MAWELEVSDKVGSWGAGGKVFRPGVYVIEDASIVVAARGNQFVSVRELVAEAAEELPAFEAFEPALSPSGVLKVADLVAKPKGFGCQLCGVTPFKSAKSLATHMRRAHGQGE